MDKEYTFLLLPLEKKNRDAFIRDMQEAFQLGAEQEYGRMNEVILPREDVEKALAGNNTCAYQAMLSGRLVGGAVISVDRKSKRNHLDFLYVKNGCQGQGLGQKIWNILEELYPDTAVWETITPYFEKRNIHFYINRCGFYAVEFYIEKDKDSHDTDDGEYFFRFEKNMQEKK